LSHPAEIRSQPVVGFHVTCVHWMPVLVATLFSLSAGIRITVRSVLTLRAGTDVFAGRLEIPATAGGRSYDDLVTRTTPLAEVNALGLRLRADVTLGNPLCTVIQDEDVGVIRG
jgi:hypothetical protein